MAGVTEYSQPLRAIGQALEALQIQSFVMEPVADVFVIRSAAPAHKPRFNLWPESSSPAISTAQDEIELRYSTRDIDVLESEGRSHRGTSNKPADAASLSQSLRGIGGYLQQKCARLLRITRTNEEVAVEYETTLGSHMKETFAMKDLYDLWVRMYLQREGRTSER